MEPRHSSALRRLALLVAVLAAGACSRAPTSDAPAVVRTVEDHFPIRVGNRVVQMQVAVLLPEMEHGLMGRRALGADEGMLFVYPGPTTLRFWMRDTPIGLDIGYFGPDGQLAEVYPLLPFDERPVVSQSRGLQFALEMNRGWYAENGIQPGDKLDLGAVAAALKARGFDPERYGLAAAP